MVFRKLLWLNFMLSVDSRMSDILRPKTIRIYKFESCPNYPDIPIQLKNVHISYSNKIHVISLKEECTEDLSEEIKLKIELKRCKSREALDSCEKYQTVGINHLCRLLNAENKPWSPMVRQSNPPMTCPILKGVREVKNGTFDGSAFAHLPVSGWYWIVTAYVLGETTNRVIMCANVEGQIAPV